jgi:hypothetical protein
VADVMTPSGPRQQWDHGITMRAAGKWRGRSASIPVAVRREAA